MTARASGLRQRILTRCSEKDADAYLAQQAKTDPDAWLIEIEDKQGRVWFPGKVVNL